MSLLCKPSYPSPYMAPIDPSNPEGIIFSCRIMEGTVIGYKIQIYESGNTSVYLSDYISASYSGSNITNLQEFPIYAGRGTESILQCRIKNLSSVLEKGKQYKWKIQLYEDTGSSSSYPSIWRDYGQFSEQQVSNTTIVKLRPHTGISPNAQDKFWLKLNNDLYQITEYSLRPDSSQTGIYAYATATISPALKKTYPKGTNYQVYANRVESDEFLFYVNSPPTIKIQMNSSNLLPDIDGAINTLNSCEASFFGLYTQSEHVDVNTHEFLLFRMDNSIPVQIASSGEIMSSSMSYVYDRFFSGEVYLIQLRIVDTNNKEWFSPFYKINADYAGGYMAYQPKYKVEPNKSAIMLDWEETMSISATIEKEELISMLRIENNASLSKGVYTDHASSDRNGAHIRKNASILWNKVDGVGELQISSDITYVWEGCLLPGIPCALLEVTADNGTVSKIEYDGYRFLVTHFNGITNTYNLYIGTSGCVSKSNIIDEGICYVWEESSSALALEESSYILENDRTRSFWWSIIVEPGSIQVKQKYGVLKGGG